MTDDLRELFEQQAAWQRSRAGLSWADKLRACVAARRGLAGLRKTPSSGQTSRAHRSPKVRPTTTTSIVTVPYLPAILLAERPDQALACSHGAS